MTDDQLVHYRSEMLEFKPRYREQVAERMASHLEYRDYLWFIKEIQGHGASMVIAGLLAYVAGMVAIPAHNSYPAAHIDALIFFAFASFFLLVRIVQRVRARSRSRSKVASSLETFALRCAVEAEGFCSGDAMSAKARSYVEDPSFGGFYAQHREEYLRLVREREVSLVPDIDYRRARRLENAPVGVLPCFADSSVPLGLPTAASAVVERIAALSLAGGSQEPQSHGSFIRSEAMDRYVPDTVAAWRADSRSDADLELIDQLGIIERSVAVADSSYSGSPLAQNRRFLESLPLGGGSNTRPASSAESLR